MFHSSELPGQPDLTTCLVQLVLCGPAWSWFQVRFHRCSCLQDPADVQTHGFDNLAYECGSQSELHVPAPSSSRATFRLPGLGLEPRAESFSSRISGLAGVESVCCCSRPLVQVDYDASVTTEQDLVLGVQDTGLDVECVVWMEVGGVHQSCLQTMEEQIGSLSGVSGIRGSLQERALMVTYRPLLVTQGELREQIQDLGFRTRVLADADLSSWQEAWSGWGSETVTVHIAGMTCSSCSSSIQDRISQVGGVTSITVSLSQGTGRVTFDPRQTEAELIRAAIEEMGFQASLTGTSAAVRLLDPLPWQPDRNALRPAGIKGAQESCDL